MKLPLAARVFTSGLRPLVDVPPKLIKHRVEEQHEFPSGEGGIRTLGTQRVHRFSRPARSTTPAPLRYLYEVQIIAVRSGMHQGRPLAKTAKLSFIGYFDGGLTPCCRYFLLFCVLESSCCHLLNRMDKAGTGLVAAARPEYSPSVQEKDGASYHRCFSGIG